MRPMILPLLALLPLTACDGDTSDLPADDDATDSDHTDTIDDSEPGEDSDAEPTCDSPGTPRTPTPTPVDDPAAWNVEPLSCTRTAKALSCELGVDSQYTETIASGRRSITANGVANHDVGSFPNPGNPNSISEQTHSYTVSVTPSGAGSNGQGVFGILFSGVVLDPGTAETWNDDGTWRYEALRYATAPPYFGPDGTDETFHPDALGVDCNLAHVQPTGAYHYHGLPTSLLPTPPAVEQVGWASDGYPIVVKNGHDDGDDATSAVRALTTSYRLKSGNRPANSPGGAYDGTFGADWEYVEGLGDLDDCNGRVDTLVVDGALTTTYVYVLTDTFPYIPRCTKAAPDPSFARAPQNGGGGGGGGQLPACEPDQTSRCCGDGTCDGPETPANCATDCP